jgi:hypothetical protein
MAQVVQVLDGANVRWAAGGRAAVRLGLGNGPARRNVVRLARTPAQPLGGASRQTQWIAEAVWRCVHERLTHSLDGVTLQDLCDEVRAIAGEPLEHRYVFHILNRLHHPPRPRWAQWRAARGAGRKTYQQGTIRRRRATKRCDASPPSPPGCGGRRPAPVLLLLDVPVALVRRRRRAVALAPGARLSADRQATRLARGDETGDQVA